jgi:hypothetical protein
VKGGCTACLPGSPWQVFKGCLCAAKMWEAWATSFMDPAAEHCRLGGGGTCFMTAGGENWGQGLRDRR